MLSAKFLKMTSFHKYCEKVLVEKMDSSNCISTWKFAENQSEDFENLRDTAFEYIRQNFEKVFIFQFTRFSSFLMLNMSY